MRREVASIVVASALVASLGCARLAEARGATHEDAPVTSVIADVVAASHVGTVDGSRTRWRSRYAFRDRTGGPARIVFAAPLPSGSEVEAPTRSILDEDGRVVAVELASDVTVVAIRTPNSAPNAVADGAHVAPPLVDGDAVQEIDVGGAQELRFEPTASQGIERRVGHFAAIDVDEDAIASAVARLGEERSTGALPLFLRASTHGRAGLDGRLTTASERSRPVVAFLGVACSLGVAALALLHRLLTRSAKIEVADAALNERFNRL